MKNYYQILEIKATASAEEIKKAYRQLSKKYHPDLNPNNKKAEDNFKEINTAYHTLIDENKRILYDWELRKCENNIPYSSPNPCTSTSYDKENVYKKSQNKHQTPPKHEPFGKPRQHPKNKSQEQKAERWQYYIILFLVISMFARLISSYVSQKEKEARNKRIYEDLYQRQQETNNKMTKKAIDSLIIPNLEVEIPDLEPIQPLAPMLPVKNYIFQTDKIARLRDSLQYVASWSVWQIRHQEWKNMYQKWQKEHLAWEKRQKLKIDTSK